MGQGCDPRHNVIRNTGFHRVHAVLEFTIALHQTQWAKQTRAWFKLTAIHSNHPGTAVRTVKIRTSGRPGKDTRMDTLSGDYRWSLDI